MTRRAVEFTEVNRHLYYLLDISLVDLASGKVGVVDSRRNRQPLSPTQIHADQLLDGTTPLEDIVSGKVQVVVGDRPARQ